MNTDVGLSQGRYPLSPFSHSCPQCGSTTVERRMWPAWSARARWVSTGAVLLLAGAGVALPTGTGSALTRLALVGAGIVAAGAWNHAYMRRGSPGLLRCLNCGFTHRPLGRAS